jgi:hypothetical protein
MTIGRTMISTNNIANESSAIVSFLLKNLESEKTMKAEKYIRVRIYMDCRTIEANHGPLLPQKKSFSCLLGISG